MFGIEGLAGSRSGGALLPETLPVGVRRTHPWIRAHGDGRSFEVPVNRHWTGRAC